MKEQELTVPSFNGLSIDQYIGPWAMESEHFARGIEFVRSVDLSDHVESARAWYAEHSPTTKGIGRDAGPGGFGFYGVSDGVARIDMIGAMTKNGSSMSDMPWGTIGIRQALREAARDPEVKSIMLRIDSPGGSVNGTGDLAADVKSISAQKPVTAFIEDRGMSAAYWVASQATRIVANESALIGSIGTYMVVDDLSGANQAAGVKTVVIRAGKYKGAGVSGTEITEDQIEDFQRTVDDLNSIFTGSVAAGRGLDAAAIENIADGRAWVASEALALGLVDAIGTYDEELKSLSCTRNGAVMEGVEITETVTDEDHKMSDKQTKDAAPVIEAATLVDLKSALPNSTAEFRETQIEAGATLTDALAAYAAQQDAQIADMKKAAEAGAKADAGFDPLSDASGKSTAGGDPISEWESRLKEKTDSGLSKSKAISALVKEDPDLHQEYLDAYNEAHAEFSKRRK